MTDIEPELKKGILKAYPDGYFCTKCERKHKKDSDIYYAHFEYASISLMYESSYNCTKCNRHHRAGTIIFEEHFEYAGEHL